MGPQEDKQKQNSSNVCDISEKYWGANKKA
jgi:hypothetical protein